MIEQGALEGVSMTFGLHLLACFKPGWLSAATGASAPAASRFSINIKGKTTHGARPEAGVDATVAASALVMNLQTIVSREMSPKQQVVVTVGQLHSGTRFNIVSGEAFLDGTVRCYDRDIHHAMPGIFERIVQGTAAAYRCEAELSYDKMVEVLINDERGSQFVYEAAKKVDGGALFGHHGGHAHVGLRRFFGVYHGRTRRLCGAGGGRQPPPPFGVF